MKKLFFTISVCLFSVSLFAHPMPNTVVNLSVLDHSITGEAKMPLIELENALGNAPDTNLNANNTFFKNYFLQHIQAISGGNIWNTTIQSIHMKNDVDMNVGNYREVIVDFELTPQKENDLHQFIFNYTAIVHQVITHKVIVFLKEDWKNGVHSETMNKPLGVIETNFKVGKFEPLAVNLDKGSWWKGFGSMVSLGMDHIKEGADHLMFLLVLLLPATLVAGNKRWLGFAGAKNSVTRLLKIVTAFTIGHSVTLLIGAFGLFVAPAQIVETLIAVSILVSAIHALRPVFPGKEYYVAAGFGLIHGLAFASVLSDMQLGVDTLMVSILGFNLGIEIMQLLIIAMIIPWLILLSKTHIYKYVRIAGALSAAIAATGWIAERISGNTNVIIKSIEMIYPYSVWLIAGIAVLSVVTYLIHIYRLKNNTLSMQVKPL